jgi:hypothetical protein
MVLASLHRILRPQLSSLRRVHALLPILRQRHGRDAATLASRSGPPEIGLDYEMDLRGAAREPVLRIRPPA